jgi:hypothetical protein
MKGRDTGLAFGLGLILLFRVPIGLAQQTDHDDSDKWMLEILRASHARDFERMSAAGKEAWAYFNDLDWQPGWNCADKSRPQPTSLGFNYRMRGPDLKVRVFLQFDSAEGLASSDQELTVGNYLIHPGEVITVSELSRFGLQPVKVKLVTAKPPEATPAEIVNKTSSL